MSGDIRIKFGANAKANAVSSYSKTVLSDLLHLSQNSECLITSTQRSPSDQARAMYDNLVYFGVDKQKALYGPYGDQVIDCYVALRKSGKSADEIKLGMERKIVEIGAANVSKHCADPSVLNVFDVAPSSLADPDAFAHAVSKDQRVSKFLQPNADPAFHLEIPQSHLSAIKTGVPALAGVAPMHAAAPAETLLLKLTKAQIDKIMHEKAIFDEVESHCGVPWEAIAAVWVRESFSVASPKTPGGPFQFDPAPGAKVFANLLRRFSDFEIARINSLAARGVNDFEAAAFLCACFLRNKIKAVITADATDDVIKEALWAYNGRAYGSSDQSSYVMNGFDSKHMNMIIRGSLPNPNGKGRIKIEVVDKRPGTFTVYKQLKQLV